jgi:hypothetical protein
MSLDFIRKFQLKIYSLLESVEFIKNNIQKIYVSVPQDGKCPFLLINIVKIKDLSKFGSFIYEIEFEICAFAQDKKSEILLKLADQVTNILTMPNCHFEDYKIAGIKVSDFIFDQAKGLTINKLTMSYKALLKKEVKS